MARRAIGFLAFCSAWALPAVFVGCGTEALPQDICHWLGDSNNCYSRFANDVGTRCGYEVGQCTEDSDPTSCTTGYFAARDDLTMCIKAAGGQVIFDPPLDVTTFPLEEVSFTLLDETAQTCATSTFSGSQTYSITVEPADSGSTVSSSGNSCGSGGADSSGAGGDDAGSDGIVGGTFSISRADNVNSVDVSCPGGLESYHFNAIMLASEQKCTDCQNLLPTAVLESSPGIPETTTSNSKIGYVRLRLYYPPASQCDEDKQLYCDPNATPRVVEYFNCSIPAPPPPCEDGVKNNTETDVDCGGDCSTQCADGQSCVNDSDCQSGSCGSEGLKVCAAAT